jgi:uncharacterized surface protein with fasciclin (FAS1) repeats
MLLISSFKKPFAAAVFAATALLACNKELPQATPIAPPTPPSTTTIAAAVAASPNFTFLLAAINRADSGVAAGSRLVDQLGNANSTYTVFAPDDDAMRLSLAALGLPPAASSFNFLPVATVRSILQYHIISGERLSAARIPTTFPNLYLQSSLILANAVPISPRMSTYPSRRATGAWVNTIPIKATDLQLANGVVHTVAAIIQPPSLVLAQIAGSNANLTYLMAAVARADSGVATASTLASALANPLANLTVFAPTNTAFQNLLIPAITQALVAQGVPLATAQAQATALASTPAVFSNPALFPVLTAQTVRALVAYHILGQAAFSVNLPASPGPATTLLVLPGTTTGLTVQVANTGAAVTVKGNANPTASNVTIGNLHAINGVAHVVDQVLVPF